MNAAILCQWLLALAPLLDGYTHGLPIRRKPALMIVIADVANRTPNPKWWAGVLDVWAAHETGYGDADAAGGCPNVPIGTLCKRSEGAKYCTPWMIECARVPVNATLHEMAEIALKYFGQSQRACPQFPFSMYSGFGCARAKLVDARMNEVSREFLTPAAVEEDEPIAIFTL